MQLYIGVILVLIILRIVFSLLGVLPKKQGKGPGIAGRGADGNKSVHSALWVAVTEASGA